MADVRIVIIGGGFGGLQAAKSLASAPVAVTLIDRENHHLFQPLLYQVATAGLAPGSIATPIRSVLAGQRNARVLLGEVVSVDLAAKLVRLEDGAQVPFDTLVLATGAANNWFGHDDWAKHAFGMKTLRDAIAIRERILLAFEAAERETDAAERQKLLSFVVIGGGPTGVETAGAISELAKQVLAADFRQVTGADIHVTLVEMADRVLTPFDSKLSGKAESALKALGVTLRLGAPVTDVTADGVHVGDTFLPASTVVWASGVQAARLGRNLGVEVDRSGRLIVDSSCALAGHPHVFAIGDCAAFTPPGGETPLPGLAPVAMQQGRFVADMISGDIRSEQRRPFAYVDKGMMATIGRSQAVAEAGRLKVSGMLAWLMWGAIHVMYLIGFRNRFIVMFNWTWSYITFKRGARLITGRPRGRLSDDLPGVPVSPRDAMDATLPPDSPGS